MTRKKKQSEAAARTAQDENAGVDYEPADNEGDPRSSSSSSGEEDVNRDVPRRDLSEAMDVDVQGVASAPNSGLAGVSPRELQGLLQSEEVTKNVSRHREGLKLIPPSSSQRAYERTLDAAVPPVQVSSLPSKKEQTVKMRPVVPQQQQSKHVHERQGKTTASPQRQEGVPDRRDLRPLHPCTARPAAAMDLIPSRAAGLRERKSELQPGNRPGKGRSVIA